VSRWWLPHLGIDHEGHDVARWLNARGIAAIILEYRLLPTPADDAQHEAELRAKLSDPSVMRALAFAHDPVMRADVLEAIRMTRRNATDWGINPQKIGVMGFSAGGHVTISAMLHYDAESRPNFAAPIYPVWFDTIVPPADAPPVPDGTVDLDDFYDEPINVPAAAHVAAAAHDLASALVARRQLSMKR